MCEGIGIAALLPQRPCVPVLAPVLADHETLPTLGYLLVVTLQKEHTPLSALSLPSSGLHIAFPGQLVDLARPSLAIESCFLTLFLQASPQCTGIEPLDGEGTGVFIYSACPLCWPAE